MIDPTPTPASPTMDETVSVNTGEVLMEGPVGDPVMRLRDVAVAFSGRTAVRDVTFDVQAGEIT
ncbi:MAG: hypothetical protein ABSC41_08580, partial [Acidimicrobiales bacterium]